MNYLIPLGIASFEPGACVSLSISYRSSRRSTQRDILSDLYLCFFPFVCISILNLLDIWHVKSKVSDKLKKIIYVYI